MRTQVGIIGSGPAGLLLARLLHLQGIDTVIIESRSRDYVLGRIRAGVIEQGMADLLREAKAGERMDREGLIHEGINIAFDGRLERLDFPKHTNGKVVMVYGQTEITHDLMKAHIDEAGGTVHYDAPAINVEGCDADFPQIIYEQDGQRRELNCEFVAGCDGYHGVARKSLPSDKLTILKESIRLAGWEFFPMCRLSTKNSSMPTMRAALRCAACVPTPAVVTTSNATPLTKWKTGPTMPFG